MTPEDPEVTCSTATLPHSREGVTCPRYTSADISVAIPTFGRDQVLIQTIECCFAQNPRAAEILIVDQTPLHDAATEQILTSWHQQGLIRWERLNAPSVTAAMNHALLKATKPLVLFLDDDVIPSAGMVAAHAAVHGCDRTWAVVGQILQPWQSPVDESHCTEVGSLNADFEFPFHSVRTAEIHSAMAGHLSVVREAALAIGGFDENFKGAAYRFETEFARRINQAGGRVMFEPSASLRHLRAERGGTRCHGNHLTSPSPHHGVGDYYFALLHGYRGDVALYVIRRLLREICTRFHARHPWYIPLKFFGECRALCWAWTLHRRGPALIRRAES